MSAAPVPALIRQASQANPAPRTPPLSARLEASIEDARELEGDAASKKRAAEVDTEELREAASATGEEAHSVLMTTAVVQNVLRSKRDLLAKYAKDPANAQNSTDESYERVEDTFEEDFMNAKVHPLRFIKEKVEKDKMNPNFVDVVDHGSWSGKWPLPSRTSWLAHETSCTLWPTGSHEVSEANTARREIKWKNIPLNERQKYRKAAEAGWKVQTDNFAFQPLSEAESKRIKARLAANGQLNKILHPRLIYTDKCQISDPWISR